MYVCHWYSYVFGEWKITLSPHPIGTLIGSPNANYEAHWLIPGTYTEDTHE